MGENSLAFTYDADGTRRTKLYSYEGGSKSHSYICDGNRVIFETVTTTEGETSTTSVIEYLYDERDVQKQHELKKYICRKTSKKSEAPQKFKIFKDF